MQDLHKKEPEIQIEESSKPIGYAAGALLFMLIFIILGFGITVQIKSVSINESLNNAPEQLRVEALQKELNTEKNKTSNLEKQIELARADLDDLRDQAADSDGTAKVLREQLAAAEKLAGLTEARGPGIQITVANKAVNMTSNNDAASFTVHEEDVLRLLNELKDAGAEAIAINGERIVAASEVRCTGTIISVNNNTYAMPFIIEAIGDKEKLNYTLNAKAGLVEVLSAYIDIRTEIRDEMKIGAFKGSVKFEFAE